MASLGICRERYHNLESVCNGCGAENGTKTEWRGTKMLLWRTKAFQIGWLNAYFCCMLDFNAEDSTCRIGWLHTYTTILVSSPVIFAEKVHQPKYQFKEKLRTAFPSRVYPTYYS
jgi:hypothetical protein